jgi:hypothetical protein
VNFIILKDNVFEDLRLVIGFITFNIL